MSVEVARMLKKLDDSAMFVSTGEFMQRVTSILAFKIICRVSGLDMGTFLYGHMPLQNL